MASASLSRLTLSTGTGVSVSGSFSHDMIPVTASDAADKKIAIRFIIDIFSQYVNLTTSSCPFPSPPEQNTIFVVRAKEIAIRVKPAVAYECPHCYIWRGTFKTVIA